MTATTERLGRGEDVGVDVAAIEREFAALWRSASGEAGAADLKPVTRACLANLVVWCEDDAHLAALKQAFDALVVSVPARVLIVKSEPARDDAPAFESYISANCILAPGGGKLVCSEEVTLVARGDGLRHVAAVVRALLVANVPTMFLLVRPPTAGTTAVTPLLGLCDRLIIDTAMLTDLRELVRMEALADGARQVVDLGWLGLAGLRSSIASVFDHDGPRAALGTLTQVNLVAPAARMAGRVLLVAWLAERLKWRGPPDNLRAGARRTSVFSGPAGALTVELTAVPAPPGGAEPETLLELVMRDQVVRVRRGSEPVALIETAVGVRSMALDPSSLGDRVARAMGPRAFDPAFPRVLARAVEMAA
ncbi:MAG: glucose-6-phosphate dehydrogenase assembly protein OpcA [Deltaproteobacteria bacterium]|nr:glucose-6-phosphate dehydrogenase assembly protein OpcA [Deltaproteobacteria bacterium]